MITKEQVKQAIDCAEAAFEECWSFLAQMKQGKVQSESMTLLEFQPKLASTLFELSALYREIEQQKKRIITSKNSYLPSWFRSRMRLLSEHQKLLLRAIGIGRGIGDGFAWAFYEQDRAYLAEHSANELQLHSPPGIGGVGELQFIKNVPVVDGYFVLYHGTTNMLRLGDVTLIDVKSRRVACIGELKSHSTEPGKLQIRLILSAPNHDGKAPQLFRSRPKQGKQGPGTPLTLSPSQQARLERQLRRISDSFRQLGKPPDQHLSVASDIHCDALEEFVSSLQQDDLSWRQVGDSIVMLGYREKEKSLYHRLSVKKEMDFLGRMSGLEKYALGLVVSGRNDNALVIESFYYDKEGVTHHLAGMAHLIWWSLSDDTIRRILFQEVHIFSVFNPAHLLAKLETTGFCVEGIGPLQFRISKTIGDRELEIGGLKYYFLMIQQYLFSEKAVIEILGEFERSLNPSSIAEPQKISLHIVQKFGLKPTAGTQA